jgi:hypothetical protein
MEGSSILASSVVANVWTGWNIVGGADFSGDGTADILWRDNAGREVLWFMNGSIITNYARLANSPKDASTVTCFSWARYGSELPETRRLKIVVHCERTTRESERETPAQLI